MTTLELILTTLTALLGSTNFLQWNAQRKKATAKATKAEIDNDRYLSENINILLLQPLKKEINALRKTTNKLKNALEKISECPHSDSCPVRHQLQHNQDSNIPEQ